jgi:hypothetical protein
MEISRQTPNFILIIAIMRYSFIRVVLAYLSALDQGNTDPEPNDGFELTESLFRIHKEAARLSALVYQEGFTETLEAGFEFFSFFDVEPDQALVAKKNDHGHLLRGLSRNHRVLGGLGSEFRHWWP